MARWGAADLVEIISKHPDDCYEQSLAIDESIREHLVPCYEEQASVDSTRLATLRHAVLGEPAQTPLPTDPERISFTQLRVAASFDPVAFRAFWRLMFMFCRPQEVYRDPQIVARTQDTLKAQGLDLLQPRGHIDPRVAPPDRQQLVAALGIGSVHA